MKGGRGGVESSSPLDTERTLYRSVTSLTAAEASSVGPERGDRADRRRSLFNNT